MRKKINSVKFNSFSFSCYQLKLLAYNKCKLKSGVLYGTNQLEGIMSKIENRSVNENFSSTIKYLRERKGYSLVELNELTGISQSYINRLENGSRVAPTVPIIAALAKALDVNLSELLEIAGIEKYRGSVQIPGELILANDFRILDKTATKEQKELLVAIIDEIIYSDWERSHYDTMANLLKLVHQFRKTV